MKAILRWLPAFFRWLATPLLTAVLTAGILAALGFGVLTTDNPVKEEIQVQAARYAREQFRSWLFGAAPQSD